MALTTLRLNCLKWTLAGSWSLAACALAACGLDPVPDPDANATDGSGDSGGDDLGSSGDTGAVESSDESGGDEGPQPAGPDSAPDPSTFGPYPVGVKTFTIEDDSRGEDGPRPLVVEVWYPATDEAIGMPTVTYAADDILRPDAVDALTSELDVGLVTTAVRDAATRTEDGPYPVVMFSHGSGGIRMQSTFLTVALASHGYVVVAPDHIGNTLSDIIVEGGLLQSSLVTSLGDRTLDLDFIVDHLKGGGEADVSAAMDFDRLGAAGHSFGALTSIRWIGKGADLDAVVAQAPPSHDIVWFGIPSDLGDTDVPIMLQVGGMDLTTPESDADTVWAQMTTPRSRMTLDNAGHFTFSDICSIDPGPIIESTDLGLADALEDGCTDANTDAVTAAAAMRNFAIAHFNVYLRDSEPSREFLTQEVGRAIVGDELRWEEER